MKTLSLLSIAALLAAPVLACDPPDIDVAKIEKKLVSLEKKRAQLQMEIAKLQSQLARTKAKKGASFGLSAKNLRANDAFALVEPKTGGGIFVIEDGSGQKKKPNKAGNIFRVETGSDGVFSFAAPAKKKKKTKKDTKMGVVTDFFYEVEPKARNKKSKSDDLEERIRRMVEEAVEEALRDVRKRRTSSKAPKAQDGAAVYWSTDALPTVKQNVQKRLNGINARIANLEIEACDAPAAIATPVAPPCVDAPVLAVAPVGDPARIRVTKQKDRPASVMSFSPQGVWTTTAPAPKATSNNSCCCCCCGKNNQNTGATLRLRTPVPSGTPAAAPQGVRYEVIYTDEDGRIIRKEVHGAPKAIKKTSTKYDPTTALPSCSDTPVAATTACEAPSCGDKPVSAPAACEVLPTCSGDKPVSAPTGCEKACCGDKPVSAPVECEKSCTPAKKVRIVQ